MFKFVLFVLTAALLSACSKGVSEPNFKFMKAPKEGVAAKVGDIEISNASLVKGIESDLYELDSKIFEAKMGRVKALILEKLMKNDPASKGLSNDEYMNKYIASGVKVRDSEINSFIKERNIPKNQVNPQIKERIRNFILTEKKRQAVDTWLANKTKKNPIEVYFEKPRRPSFDVKVGDSVIYGDKNAKVIITEFSDFQCPYCSKGAEVITELKKKYGKKIAIVFKQYPLPFHSQAKQAANAALCANEQNSKYFWSMHDKMFADQTKLSKEDLKKTAAGLGLNQEAFSKCLDGDKFFAKIDAEIQEGKDLGIKSTPTFFVNGMLVQGAQPLDVFSEIIDEELK